MLEIVYQFGGRKNVIILIMFAVSFFIVNSFARRMFWRFVLALLSSLFVVLQMISLYSTQAFISYQFYIHFNLRGISGLTVLFIPHIIAAGFVFVMLLMLNYFAHALSLKLHRLLNKELGAFTTKASAIIIGSFILLTIVFKGNFMNDTKSLMSIFNTNNAGFREVLQANNIDGYITPEQINCTAGKNIIVLSLESLEKSFLSDKFAALTPNLNRLKSNYNYYEIEQNFGSGWTSASLYTYLTGFPAFFGASENRIFQNVKYSQITSISHILEKADYTTVYMNGNTDFSGVKEMLNAFRFDKIIDYRSAKNTGYESNYGLRDKDIFDLAKEEIRVLRKSDEHFALFISTTDTHFPNGIYDARMESVISKKNSDLEFMVAALDYEIGDLISYLEEEGLLQNTVFYIFPDHQKMGNPAMFKGTGARGLYLITNSNSIAIDDSSQVLYQVDLPCMILQGAKIKHNVNFLTDYIKGDKNEYIKNNIFALTAINTNGLHRIGYQAFHKKKISENYIRYKKDTSRFIAHAGGAIDDRIYTNSKEALDLNYKKGFRLFELDILQTKDGEFIAAHNWKLWADMANFRGEVPASRSQFLECKIYDEYTPLDMDAINEWFLNHKDAILITDKVNEPINFSRRFIDKNRLMMELFDMDSVKSGVEIGILSAMPSQELIESFTTDDVRSLALLGVKNIAISWEFIENNKGILIEYKKYNIKPYAFMLNLVPGIDEEYVTKYDMDYIFGIYADKCIIE